MMSRTKKELLKMTRKYNDNIIRTVRNFFKSLPVAMSRNSAKPQLISALKVEANSMKGSAGS